MTPHQEGMRKKFILIPEETDLKRGFKDRFYLFKSSSEQHPWNFWVEILAYFLSCKVGVKVPKTYLANYQGSYGSLQQWCYNHNETFTFNLNKSKVSQKYKVDPLVKGSKILQVYDNSYPQRLNEDMHILEDKHNISNCINALCQRTIGIDEGQYWVDCKEVTNQFLEMLCWDALIGNSDRHEGNWAVMWNQKKQRYQLSPFFDNGASLTHVIKEEEILRYQNDEKKCLSRYLVGGGNTKQKKKRKGKHHICWEESKPDRGFYELVKKMITQYNPVFLGGIQQKFKEVNIDEYLQEMEVFTRTDCLGSTLTPERLNLIGLVLKNRKRLLLDALRGG